MKNNNWIKFLFVFICITFASHPSMAEGKVKAPTTKPVVKTPKKAETKAPVKDPKANATLNKIKPESVKEENTDATEAELEGSNKEKEQSKGKFPKVAVLKPQIILHSKVVFKPEELRKKIADDLEESDEFLAVKVKKTLGDILFTQSNQALKTQKNQNYLRTQLEKFILSSLKVKSPDKLEQLEKDFQNQLNKISNTPLYEKEMKLLSNLYVHFASLSFRGSKDNSLKNWIKKYFSYNKTHKVVPGLPDYLKTLQKQVYDDLYKQKKLKVRIISIPEDSQVYFNGKEAGSGNLLITNITPGIHSLTIKREGFTEFGKVLELKENSHPTTVVKTPLLPRESSTYYSFIENNSRNSFAKDPKSGIVNFITKNTGLKTDSADYFLLPLIYPKNKKDLYIFSYAYHSKTNTVIPLKTILAASSISEIAIEYDQVITQVQDHFYNHVKIEALKEWDKVKFVKFSSQTPEENSYTQAKIHAKVVGKDDETKKSIGGGQGLTLLEKLEQEDEIMDLDDPLSNKKRVKEVRIQNKPFYKETWFFIAAGALAAGGIATAFLMSSGEEPVEEGGNISFWYPNSAEQ